METMAFIPVAQIGGFGAMLLLAGSLLAAILGIVAFAWAMVLLWRENNPQGIMMRGRANAVEDVNDNEDTVAKSPREKILAWVTR